MIRLKSIEIIWANMPKIQVSMHLFRYVGHCEGTEGKFQQKRYGTLG